MAEQTIGRIEFGPVNTLCGELATTGRVPDAAIVGELWQDYERQKAEIARLRAALKKARGYLRPPAGTHYPHGTTYAVQEIDGALADAHPR